MLAYLIDAFTTRRFEGNRAGVVFDADELTHTDKLLLASEIGASETAFVMRSDCADYKMEFFTPTTQIDFCGHATIAAFYMLAELERVRISDGPINLTQETKAGILPISLSIADRRTLVTMTQRKPQFAPVAISVNEIARALNMSPDVLDDRFPLTLSNTGNWHLIIGVKAKQYLDAITYDAALLSKILTEYGAVTAHVFHTADTNRFHARNFCPTIGIPEDPATGAAAGAFVAYLAHIGFLPEGNSEIQIFQGEAMGRPSQIVARVESRGSEVHEVQVSGTAELSFYLTLGRMPVRSCR